jgi:hypothetical protein
MHGHIRNKIFVKHGENTNKKQRNKATGKTIKHKLIRTSYNLLIVDIFKKLAGHCD